MTVAVAGLGSVGRQIVLACARRGHNVIGLTCTPTQPEAVTASGARIVVLDDYDSVPALAAAVGGADAVISCLFSADAAACVRAQENLLAACCVPGSRVRRFAPSEFAYSAAANHTMQLYAPKRAVWRAVQQSPIPEFTAFRTGQFLNYLAFGSPLEGGAQTDGREAGQETAGKGSDGKEVGLAGGLAGVRAMPFIVDVAAGHAEVPGTGNEPVTMVRTQDVGEFVARAVELSEPWPAELGMGGCVTTYNAVVAEAQRLTGRPFAVTYRCVAELEGMIRREEEEERSSATAGAGRKFYLQAMLAVARGEAHVDMNLNSMVDVPAWTMEQFMQRWWGNGAGEV